MHTVSHRKTSFRNAVLMSVGRSLRHTVSNERAPGRPSQCSGHVCRKHLVKRSRGSPGCALWHAAIQRAVEVQDIEAAAPESLLARASGLLVAGL